MRELDAGIGSGEAPVEGGPGGVARGFPGGDFAGQGRLVGQAAVEAISVRVYEAAYVETLLGE